MAPSERAARMAEQLYGPLDGAGIVAIVCLPLDKDDP